MNSWSCPKCTYLNDNKVSNCEICLYQYCRRFSSFNDNSTYKSLSRKKSIDDSVVPDDFAKDLIRAHRIKEKIIEKLKSNQKFVDPEFPPCKFSISNGKCRQQGVLNAPIPESQGRSILTNSLNVAAQWLRPECLRGDEYSDVSLEWAVTRNPSSEDIVQGRLGNCWLLTGLALTADRAVLLDRILITKQIDPHGIYQVRLCKDGIWRVVTIDDLFPANNFSHMIYARANRKQLWVSLIEKAAAKLYGCYEALTLGYCADGLSTVTGSPCETLKITDLYTPVAQESAMLSEHAMGPVKNIYYEGANDDDKDTIDTAWAKVLSAKDANFIMCASCGSQDDNQQFLGKLQQLGLSNLHAYAILDAVDLPDLNIRLVRLKNPWARLTWRGEWSDGHSSWNRIPNYIREELQPSGVSGESCGVFWIGWQDLLTYFFAIDICRYYSKSKGSNFDNNGLVDGSWCEMRLQTHLPWPVWFDWTNEGDRDRCRNGNDEYFINNTDDTTSMSVLTGARRRRSSSFNNYHVTSSYSTAVPESSATTTNTSGSAALMLNNPLGDGSIRSESPLPDIEQDSNTCAVLEVFEASQVQVVLWQSTSRTNELTDRQLDLLLVICREYQQHPVGPLVASSSRLTSSYVVCDVLLDPGIYTIFYLSFYHWQATIILDKIRINHHRSFDGSSDSIECLDFPPPPAVTNSMFNCTLSVHSSKPVRLKRAVLTPSMIPEVMIELAIRRGRLQLFGQIQVYSLMKTCSGMIALVVNPSHTHQSVRCTSDSIGSLNLINSRSHQFHKSEDIIHPGYCQITTLWTQEDAYSSFSLQHKYTATLSYKHGSDSMLRVVKGLEKDYPILRDAPDKNHWPPIQLVIHRPWPIRYTNL